MRMHGYSVSTVTLGSARPRAAISAVNKGVMAAGQHGSEVGVGKLINLWARTRAVELPL